MVTTATGIATSYIQFTRASNATVTNNVGNIAWAGHNLLTNSESFDASSWTKYLCPISANVQVAPNGTTTADTATTSDNYSAIYTSVGVTTGAVYTFSFFAKRGTMTDAKLSVRDVNNAVDIIPATSYYSTINSSTWTLVTQTFTIPAGCSTILVNMLKESFVTGTIHLWGASLYRSDLGGMVFNPAQPAGLGTYYPTTPPNLLGFTEDFASGAWVKFGVAVASNNAIAPNGLQTADKIVADSTSGNHLFYINSAPVVTASPYTMSIYAKAAENSWIYVRCDTSVAGGVWFDLSTGTKGTEDSGRVGSITSVGNGWYRCSVRATLSAGNGYGAVHLAPSNGVTAFTGNGISGVYFWGAQFSDSASIDAYSPVYGAAVTSSAYYAPRLDYSPTTIQPLGMLVEEQRTNIVSNSNVFNAALFQTTVTPNAAISPSGLTDASSLSCTSTTGRSIISTTLTNAISYVLSVFIKAGTNTSAYFEPAGNAVGSTVVFNLSNGTITSGTGGSITPASNGYYRCSATFTATSTGASDLRIGTGDATSKTIFVYGLQIEAGSFPTSYIPTGASSVTRSADNASVSTQAFPYSATEGTIVANVMFANYVSGDGRLGGVVGLGSSSPRIILAMGTSSTRPFFAQMYDGTNITNLSKPNFSDLSVNTPHKVGIAYTTASGGASAFTWDGISASSSTNANALNLSGMATMQIGTQPDAPLYFNGHIRQITYLPRRITNAELQTRTT